MTHSSPWPCRSGRSKLRNWACVQSFGGQQQRVSIASALAADPTLPDEATSALDPETTAHILALLQDINRCLGLSIALIIHKMGAIRAWPS